MKCVVCGMEHSSEIWFEMIKSQRKMVKDGKEWVWIAETFC